LTLPSELLAFCAVAVVFSLAPGPDTVLVVNRALGHGRRTALMTALGSASCRKASVFAREVRCGRVLADE
jgi:threonine/homoserine/homoserine lactone efflux protein